MEQILKGYRVVEWGALHQGPSAAIKMAEMGAEVIKLEEPGKGDQSRGMVRTSGAPAILPSGRNWFFEFLNYGKKSVTFNMKSPKGKEAAYRLIEKSDIFITNYRKSAAVRVGLDYQSLRKVNPRLIYASGSCMGTKGPLGESAGIELVALAKSGMMSVAGEANEPPQRIASSICDQTGGLMLVIGIMGAIIARERYGMGQEITSSQLGGAMLLQIFNVMGRILTGTELPRDNRLAPRNILYNQYLCQDGKWLMLGMVGDRYWEAFCRAVGHPEWIDDPKFKTPESRVKNAAELASLVSGMFASQPYKHWEEKLMKADLLFSVVNSISDLLTDPQVVANNYLPEIDHPTLGKTRWMFTPIEFSGTPLAFGCPAPELGQHTEEVLTEVCGYSWEDVNQMRESHAI